MQLEGLNKTEGYVVAVSGGVDSMVLLDLLVRSGYERMVCAHYVHGVRSDTEQEADRAVISKFCEQHQLELITDTYNGDATDEATLRHRRYAFLESVLKDKNYNAIITAHHQDDSIETAIINLLRGTQGAGLASIKSDGDIRRPLLSSRKEQILDYARKNKIAWHEDSTNQDETYLRNYIRKNIVANMTEQQRTELLGHIKTEQTVRKEIDEHAQFIERFVGEETINLSDFIGLPHVVSKYAMKLYLERYADIEISNQLIERAVIFAKTGRTGAQHEIGGRQALVKSADTLQVLSSD